MQLYREKGVGVNGQLIFSAVVRVPAARSPKRVGPLLDEGGATQHLLHTVRWCFIFTFFFCFIHWLLHNSRGGLPWQQLCFL